MRWATCQAQQRPEFAPSLRREKFLFWSDVARNERRICSGSRKTREEIIMATTVSEFLVERLRWWGVQLIFGSPGDGINGIFGALRRANDNPRFMQARHEELAAFMACAH